MIQNAQEQFSKDHMTDRDLAELLGLSPSTLQRWHRQRKGPPRIKIGRRAFYRKKAVDAWLLQQEISFNV